MFAVLRAVPTARFTPTASPLELLATQASQRIAPMQHILGFLDPPPTLY